MNILKINLNKKRDNLSFLMETTLVLNIIFGKLHGLNFHKEARSTHKKRAYALNIW